MTRKTMDFGEENSTNIYQAHALKSKMAPVKYYDLILCVALISWISTIRTDLSLIVW